MVTIKYNLTVIYLYFCFFFQFKGRNFDKNGNLNKWWTNTTLEQFENKTSCLQNHYNKFDEDKVMKHY